MTVHVHIPCLINLDDLYQLEPDQAPSVQVPGVIDFLLTPYQAAAVDALATYPGSVITSRSGMGRSVTAIAAGAGQLARGEIEHVIVMTPPVLLAARAQTIETMTGDHVLQIGATSLKTLAANDITEAHWIVAPYSLARRLANDPHFLDVASTSLLVLDQTQNVKNPDAQRTQGVLAIGRHARRRSVLLSSAALTTIEWAHILTGVVDPELAIVPAIDLHKMSHGLGPCSPKALLVENRKRFALTKDQLALALVLAPTWSTSLTKLTETAALLRPANAAL